MIESQDIAFVLYNFPPKHQKVKNKIINRSAMQQTLKNADLVEELQNNAVGWARQKTPAQVRYSELESYCCV